MCPGAPFLMEGTADAIAGRQSEVVRACAAVVARLPEADTTLLITGPAGPVAPASAPVPGWRLLESGTRIRATGVRRSDLPDDYGLTLGPDIANVERPVVEDPLVGTAVGAYLLGRGDARRPGPTTIALEVGVDPVQAAQAVEERLTAAGRVAVLVVADGSACHGDAAPGRRDDRAAAFDEELAKALESGDPVALARACADAMLARELLAGIGPLAVFAQLTGGRPATSAALLYSAAPLGVGYFVASWRWDES